MPRLGSMFGRYRIESVVGRGGMGVVVRATDVELGRVVALKFLAPELRDVPEMRERFVREPRLAAAIEHPNIVPIHDAGVIDGTPYIAMRAIPGVDLATVLRREAPLGVPRTTDIVGQLADALDAAHRRNLVHRDVKPGNVLIEPADDGAPERAWLTDFGLTRRLGDPTTVTLAGPAGTIDYLAPELVTGDAIGPWSDQYALACLAVHCLTGAPPWDGPSDGAVLYAHVHGDRASLAERLPAGAAAAVIRALDVAPERRFPDCRTFAQALSGRGPARVAAPPDEPTAPADSGRPGPDASAPSADRAAVDVPRIPRGAPPRRRAAALGIIGVGVLALGAGGLLLATNEGSPGRFASSTDPLPDRTPAVLDGRGEGVIVFSGGHPGAPDEVGELDLWAIEPDASAPIRLTSAPGEEGLPAVTPDGTAIVYAAGPVSARDLWLLRLDGSEPVQLTRHPADDYAPAISPDGTKLAWTSTRGGTADILLGDLTAKGIAETKARNLTRLPGVGAWQDSFPAWSSDGTWLAYMSNRGGEGADIWRMDPEHPEEARALMDDAWVDGTPVIDLDGSIVFMSQRLDYQRKLYRMVARLPPSRLTHSDRSLIMPDVAPDGTRIVAAEGMVRSGIEAGRTDLVILTRDGEPLRTFDLGMRVATEPDWVERLILGPGFRSSPAPAASGPAD